MEDEKAKEKITIKQIFGDQWSEFKQHKWQTIPETMRASVEDAVSKMLGCGNPINQKPRYLCFRIL